MNNEPIFYFPREVAEQFATSAGAAGDNEVCGLLTGKKNTVMNLHMITNIFDADPQWGYNMEPREVLQVLQTTTMFDKNNALDLCGTIHSHPKNIAWPSLTDVTYALASGYLTVYVIYSVIDKEFNAYRWDGRSFIMIQMEFI